MQKPSGVLTITTGLLSIEKDATQDQIKKAYRKVRLPPFCEAPSSQLFTFFPHLLTT